MSAANLKEVEWAISELEAEESSLSVYSKLASMYIVRDHMTGSVAGVPPFAAYSEAAEPVTQETTPLYGRSDFLRLVSEVDPATAWNIMDELMGNLQVVNPRVYRSIMGKLERA